MLLRQPAVSVVGLEGCVDARSGKAVHVASIFSRQVTCVQLDTKLSNREDVVKDEIIS